MGKEKPAKGPKGIPNRALHARISYLHQAVSYLSASVQPWADGRSATSAPAEQPSTGAKRIEERHGKNAETAAGSKALTDTKETPSLEPPLYLASHIRSVSRKSQVRLSQDIKRSLCKRCDTLLIPGKTSDSKLANLSYEGRKPWADVLVIQCKTCGAEKRFPVGAKRQQRKAARQAQKAAASD
ncbi:hypothetical protein W97_05439 [Coniosporium apollinis CBS 100218]|uniref:Rpr2-domain-containing protein n=1 Tax=Coniosporium apollinis (strain CBS 100218) TaxID=1168221 RepID=R7YWQ6_CONA1|nr:uncharacterized protein W97_05439 [Coniosporium apollinis CBS 100218]EON66342.1 hypothetical protein W97_05439 [Coniosporium apollinis CBS 100218]